MRKLTDPARAHSALPSPTTVATVGARRPRLGGALRAEGWPGVVPRLGLQDGAADGRL